MLSFIHDLLTPWQRADEWSRIAAGRQDIIVQQMGYINTLETEIAEIIADIRDACGCTDGDDIRSHLSDYLEGEE